MKTRSSLLELNYGAFNNFIKLATSDKIRELKQKAVLVDRDMDNEIAVNLYFLNGFFVEEVVSKKENKTLDVIPYKHGYRTENFVEVVEVIVPKLRLELVA